MAWAIEQREIKDPSVKFVLVCLANYADACGANAFPAIQRLCQDTALSESTVRRALQSLEKQALIVKGNQSVAAAQISRVDRRPVVYDLLMERGVHMTPRRGVTLTPREGNGVSGEGSRGVTEGLTGCQALTPDPKKSVREPKSDKKSFEEEFRSRFGYSPTEIPAQKGREK